MGNVDDFGGTREEKAVLLAEHAGASVYHADWRALLGVVPECDAVIVDAPYSERTHAANDGSAKRAPVGMDEPGKATSALAYASWTPADVFAFVGAWSPRCSGWFASITDHTLAREWEAAMVAAGRYVFAPLPIVQKGMNIRLAGDGPSNWTCWLVVARPRTGPVVKWGTLRGAYVGNPFDPGENTVTSSRRSFVVGGKPLWLMERLVEDYTRPGALVVDPCCGAGTTLVAAQRTGRRAIGGDAMREHAEIAAKRISKPAQAPLFVAGSNGVSHATQSKLFEEGESEG